MGETRVRWIAWARAMRRRWTCRRASRVPLDLVWLRLGRVAAAEQTSRSAPRPLALRLSIAPSIAIHWASRILALSDRVSTARKRHTIAMNVRSVAALHAGTARVSPDGVHTSAWDGLKAVPRKASDVDHRSDSLRSRLHAMVMPSTLPTSVVALRSPIHAPATLQWTRVPADAGRFATVPMTPGRTRIEPRVLAPPPMVGRMPQQTVVSGASLGRQESHDFHSPSGFATGERNGWMPAAGALAGAVSPALLASVTDHVVREIDGRVRARRERLGKV